ncbi:HTTM domain-containing protein [Streptomyces boncukensis]|uniref:HTTM domain-containing protein n=1 Tax=Streptomyces boncukensis TaxID=2711219 RepID=A0A6G4WR36_9ACTN|nr:HTTM domain-containing protein [Streptomyces boncukensis]NGO67726.1 HTTM domain-containing protein [Streptomyces boncukensis]
MTVRQAVRYVDGALVSSGRRLSARASRLTREPFGLHSAAAIRIGLAGLYLLSLVREIGHADRLWGPGAPFTPELFRTVMEQRGWDGGPLGWWYTLLDTRSAPAFWSFYAAAAAVSLLLMLGWHTRVMAVLFCFAVVPFYMRGSMANSGWELLSLLFATLLVCCASGRRWSLDARRRSRARGADGGVRVPRWGEETEEVRRRAVTVLHNCGMALIALQVMVVYCSAAMYKIQGESWRDGTALYYVLRSDDFSSWPALSDWLSGHGTLLALLAYVTVFSQMLFPALVFHRRLKYCVLLVMLSTHLGIGVLMGLPMFSAVTIVGDLVFVPTACWLRVTGLVRLIRAPAQPAETPSAAPERVTSA